MPEPIAYDHAKIKELLGGKLPPLTHRLDQMTARALLDPMLPQRTSNDAHGRFLDARYWVERAYQQGNADGRTFERERIREKMRAEERRLLDACDRGGRLS